MRSTQTGHRWAAMMVAAILMTLAAAMATPAQTFAVLYTFTGGMDGGSPSSGLIRDSAGNLYGTTAFGGYVTGSCTEGCGTVFKVQKNGKESVLYRFKGAADGGSPEAGNLVRDQSGNLYGATRSGGDLTCAINSGHGCGTVSKWTQPGRSLCSTALPMERTVDFPTAVWSGTLWATLMVRPQSVETSHAL